MAGEIGRITRTPAPELTADAGASGEALKQREIGLLGKVQRFQVKAGNAWEDAVRLAARVQSAYGLEQPPAFEDVSARWRDPEIRNDKQTVENVLMVADRIGELETLRQLAGVFGWGDDKIQALMDERHGDTQRNLMAAAMALPGFNTATFGLTGLATWNGNGAAQHETIGA